MPSNESQNSPSHPVIQLADALHEVYFHVGKLPEMIRLFLYRPGLPVGENVDHYRRMNPQEKQKSDELYQEHIVDGGFLKTILDAIAHAIDAINGTDPYIRQATGTRPGEWTTEVKTLLATFHSNMLQHGHYLSWVVNQGIFGPVLYKLSEYENRLRNIDLPALDQIHNQYRHSPDFRSAYWFGVDYRFTSGQSDAIEILWEAWENKTPEVGENYILETIGLDTEHLKNIFQGHPAWGAMIQPGGTKGSFRLVETKI
jgi:hypothetical protein